MASGASMSDTRKMKRLETQLEKLIVHVPVPSYGAAQILENPIDIYRSYLANILEPMLKDARSQNVYDSIQYTNRLSHGDLIIVIPRLQLKRSNPIEVAKDLASQVNSPDPFGFICSRIWSLTDVVSNASPFRTIDSCWHSPATIL